MMKVSNPMSGSMQFKFGKSSVLICPFLPFIVLLLVLSMNPKESLSDSLVSFGFERIKSPKMQRQQIKLLKCTEIRIRSERMMKMRKTLNKQTVELLVLKTLDPSIALPLYYLTKKTRRNLNK